MKTVFDLVALFVVIKREKEGDPAVTSTKEVVLEEGLTPTNCCAGRSAFDIHVKRLAKAHIKTEGLERVWLKDWEFRERKVAEAA